MQSVVAKLKDRQTQRDAIHLRKLKQTYSQLVVTPEYNTPSISHSLSLSGSAFPLPRPIPVMP